MKTTFEGVPNIYGSENTYFEIVPNFGKLPVSFIILYMSVPAVKSNSTIRYYGGYSHFREQTLPER